jgi:hypothetical protein
MKRFTWETGFDTPRILRNLASCRMIDKDGRVSFRSGEYRYWLPILETAVRADDTVGQQLKHNCIVQAVNDPAVSLMHADLFLQRCGSACDALTGRPKRNFVVVSSLTYAGEPLFSRLADGEVHVQWQQPRSTTKFMRNVLTARESLQAQRRNHNVPEQPAGFANLLVHVSAYDTHDAHTLATNAIDSLRGMLNLLINSNLQVSPFGRIGRPHAINRFRSGPYRTIHNLDGTLATETFWYEHRWLHETPTVKFTSAKEFGEKALRVWWSKLQHNPLGNHVRQGLLRYCRGLDLHDAEPAILEMWGALETLTGTQREKGDLTVDRAVQLFIERDDARQMANHIRIRRNTSVHAARSFDFAEVDAILVQAEELVSRVLFFCLKEGRRFANQHELYDFLDLRLDEAKLRRTTTLSKFFVEYQRRKPI